jgi:2-haloacid dehalogenase
MPLQLTSYGTLIDWESGILAELKPWLAPHGLGLTDDQILEAFGVEESRLEAATPRKFYPDILADVLRALGKRWNVSATDTAAAEFGRSVPRWPAFPDTVAALQHLKRHFKLVILSNVDRASFAKSNEKLKVEFDRVFTAEDIGSYKPDIRNFRYALSELATIGLRPEHILHTAQSLFHDIVPAKSLGLKTAWINRRKGRASAGATPVPKGDATPDLEVASMAEFAALHKTQLG